MRGKKWMGVMAFVFIAGVATSVFAQEGAALSDEVKKWLAISAGFGIALASIGGALGQGRAISSAVEGIARNPGAQMKIFIPLIVGLALIESLVLYAWIVSLRLSGKL